VLNFTTIQDKIYDWINTESGREAIWDNQNNPFNKPAEPYFSIGLGTFDAPNHAYKSVPNLDGFSTFRTDEAFTLLIRGFGPGIVQLTQGLKKSLQFERVQVLLREAGLAIVDWFSVLDISGLDGTEMQERSSFDLRLRIADEETDEVGIIETAIVDGVLTGSKFDQTISVEAGGAVDYIWELIAEKAHSLHLSIAGIAELSNELYVTGDTYGRLYKWDELNSFIEVIGGNNYSRTDLILYDDKLWASGGWYEKLCGFYHDLPPLTAYRYCFSSGSASSNYSVKVIPLNGNVYIITRNRRLLIWNGWFSNVMTPVTTTLSTTPYARFYSGILFNNEIYASGEYGILVKWNGIDAWELLKAPDILLGTVYELCIFENELYGVMNEYIVKWNGVDNWVRVTEEITGYGNLRCLTVYKGMLVTGTNYCKLYRVSLFTGKLVQLVHTTSLLNISNQYLNKLYARSDGYLYAGTSGSLGAYLLRVKIN
jgi:hypothetical protein